MERLVARHGVSGSRPLPPAAALRSRARGARLRRAPAGACRGSDRARRGRRLADHARAAARRPHARPRRPVARGHPDAGGAAGDRAGDPRPGRSGSDARAGGARAPRRPPLAPGRCWVRSTTTAARCASRPRSWSRAMARQHADAPEAARLRDAADARAAGRRRPLDPAVGAPRARRASRSAGDPGAGPDRLRADDRSPHGRAPHGGRRRARLTRHGRRRRRSRRWSGFRGIDRSTSSPGTPTSRSARSRRPPPSPRWSRRSALPRFPRRPSWGCFTRAGRPSEALAGEVARGTPSSAALAAALLGEIGDRRATDALTRAIAAPEGGAAVVRVAIEALERLSDPAAVPALARAAEAPQADVRLQAFAALLALADPRSVAVLDGGLADRDPRVRASAARAGRPARRPRCRPGAGRSARRRRFRGAVRGRSRAGPHRRRAAGPDAGRPSPRTATTTRGAPRDSAELEAIGDALEANVTRRRRPASRRSIPGGRARPARTPRARARRRARDRAARQQQRRRRPRDRAPRRRAERPPWRRPISSATARLSDGEVAALARAFADAEPAVRGRLCAAIARTPRGGGWLASLDRVPVRAVAGAGRRGLVRARARRRTLGARGRGARPRRTAGGQRARRAGRRRAEGARAAARSGCARPTVRRSSGRWVTLEGGGVAVAAMTDETGLARVDGLSAAATAAWHADGLSLRGRANRTMTPAIARGRSPATTPSPSSGASASPAAPCT